jgi:hypothetical protein
MKRLIIILAVLLTLYVNIYAENPYKQFGCEGKELLTEQEKSGERTFIVVSNDSLSEFKKIVFDFKEYNYYIYDKDSTLIKTGIFDMLIPKRWLSMDPLASKFPQQSPYSGFDDNPIFLIDPDGKSTHTSNDGTVIAVYNDKDLGVYKQDVNSNFIGPMTVKTGELKGQTKFWDEFRAIDHNGQTSAEIGKGAKIEFNVKWDPIINTFHKESLKLNLYEIAEQSKPNRRLDIKKDKKITPSEYTGREFNGYYISARSAGNYLAGYNGATGKLFDTYISWETYIRLAGALQQKKYTTWNAIDIVMSKAKSFGPPPYYGEEEYSGRWIQAGWKKGMSERPSGWDIKIERNYRGR